MNTDYISRVIINHKPLGTYIYMILDADSAGLEAIFGACTVEGNIKEEKQT